MAVTRAHLDSSRNVILRNVDNTSLVLQFVGGQRAVLPVDSPNQGYKILGATLRLCRDVSSIGRVGNFD